MTIIRVCCVCGEELGRFENEDKEAGEAKTHGYCRFHYLEVAVKNDLANGEEKREYYKLLAER